MAETEEGPQPFEILDRVQGAIIPGSSKLPEDVDVNLLELAVALLRAPIEKAALKKSFVFSLRLPVEVTRLGVFQKLGDGVCDRWNVRTDDADLSGLTPARDQVRSGFP